jgi:hypothetical protein
MNFTLNYIQNINKKIGNKIEKKLVYYCATGRYLDIIKININELKKYYNDDIVLLTDHDIHIPNIRLFKYNGDPTIGRAFIDKYININDYDKIMYLDADAIPLKNFYKIWDINNNDIGVSVQTIKIGQCRNKYKFWFTQKMNNEEITKYSDKYAINSGVLITKINIFEKWRNLINGKYEDQSSLNKLLIVGNYKYHEIKNLISSEKWMFNTKPDGSIYHFCGQDIKEKMSRIKKMFHE